MTTYVALLRAINVGGARKVKMSDLRTMFAAMGYGDAQTYIQSGNVVFQAEEDEQPLRQFIERQIEASFGFPVTVALRASDEMALLTAQSPFQPDTLAEGESLYVALLTETPSPEGAERLLASETTPDEFRLIGREVYLLYRRSMRDTKLTNTLLEKRLGVAATSRNWRTITTLAAMSATMANDE
ncbi:MAG TPA: DUF1697 domain-containing protein [Ktedonobacterales bacterium]|nr:DUF1697 domain-containing protein [Ktedonobacterales bacterium]